MAPLRRPQAWGIGLLVGILLCEALLAPPAGPTDVRYAAETLLTLALSIGLSLAAGAILEARRDSPVQDERPTPLATRGSYMAWLSGVRRLGYVVVWAGERRTRKESIGGKGTLFKRRARIYTEAGVHVICVGPVDELLSIEQGGRTIFEGPITPSTHPSGTSINIGDEGIFTIYWGEDDQPVNTNLGDSSRIGISSRWPNICYVHWTIKRLGSSPVWPMMSYEVLKRPTGNYLANTEPSEVAGRTLDGPTLEGFTASDGGGGAGNGTITVEGFINAPGSGTTVTVDPFNGNEEFFAGDISSKFRWGQQVRLVGNTISDRDLTIADFTVELADTLGFTTYRTILTFEEDITGIDNTGSIQLYTEDLKDSNNIAHSVADMLFESRPYGLGLSQSDWDMDSLEDMGTLANDEGLVTGIFAQNAETVEARLAGILQDMGYFLPIDPTTGLLKFVPLRKPSGTLDNISDLMVVDSLPELIKAFGEKPVDFMMFEFPDRAINYRNMTIARMDDGQIGRINHDNARKIPITITTNYDSAATIANRRTQEELAQPAGWTIASNRAARRLIPGQAVTSEFSDEVLRIFEVEPVPDSNRVSVTLMTDVYGTFVQDFEDSQPPGAGTPTPAQNDLSFHPVEVPEYISGIPPQTLIVPRIRAHDQIEEAVLHISADDTTYVATTTSDVHNPGGTLQTALTADGFFEPEDGTITIFATGPDIADVLDLSGDDTNWRLGRQLAIIASSAGTEICFLKKVTAVSGSSYSLDGLIRARYDTRRLAHPVDSAIYIVDQQNFAALEDPLLLPEVTRYIKSQPFGNGTVTLDLVPAEQIDLYGKGIRPPAVGGLRVTSPEPVNAYSSGDDLVIEWNYPTPRTPGTSAGLQGAGTAVGDTEPEGPFQVDILTTGNTLVNSYTNTDASFEYSNASLVSDLGSEVSFKVRVYQLRDGYVSDPTTLTVEKV